MSWLSTPGFFTRWMTERAIKHKAEKEKQGKLGEYEKSKGSKG